MEGVRTFEAIGDLPYHTGEQRVKRRRALRMDDGYLPLLVSPHHPL